LGWACLTEPETEEKAVSNRKQTAVGPFRVGRVDRIQPRGDRGFSFQSLDQASDQATGDAQDRSRRQIFLKDQAHAIAGAPVLRMARETAFPDE
jgi:hypothetical protein